VQRPVVTLEQWLGRNSGLLCRLAAYTTAALVCAPFLYHLAYGSRAFLGLFEDDYFYYAIIADKLVTLGKLTYDGTTITNGFHPLWFVVIWALRVVFGRFGTAYYVALTSVFFASLCVTYELSRRFARALGASAIAAPAIAAVYIFCAGRLFTMGMECDLAVPLLLWLLIEVARNEELTPRRAAKLGLLASLAILARLDIALAVGMLLAAWAILARPSFGEAKRLLVPFGLGGLLAPAYAVANWVIFGNVMPMSALAKHLLVVHRFSISYAWVALVGTVFGPTAGLVLFLGLCAAIVSWRESPGGRPAARVAGTVAIVFSALFYFINATPGWIFFGWYAYPLVTALVAALAFIVERAPRYVKDVRVRAAAAAAAVALAPAMALRHYLQHGPQWSLSDNSLLAAAFDVADRVHDRDGVYSMGAIGGMVTYALDKPVVQLEGLVADRAMVEHIRHEDPLSEVIPTYGIDYLIVSFAYEKPPKHDGCYIITQPNKVWAGKWTAKMRGEICSEPVERIFTPRGTNRWSIFPDVETLIFDVRHAQWR
jgi:hypothetical protein